MKTTLLSDVHGVPTNSVPLVGGPRHYGLAPVSPLILRDYQVGINGDVSAAWRQGAKKVLVSSPCGSGKTEISIDMAQRCAANGRSTIFCCDRIAIIQQTIRRFIRAGLDVGVLWRDATRNLDAPVLIAMSPTVQSRGLELVDDRFLVVIDEAHIDRLTSHRIVDRIVERGGYAVGLTGTPIGRSIAGRWDALVSGPTTCDLATQGHAVVPELVQRWSPDQAELDGIELDKGGEFSAGGAGELMIRFAEAIADDLERWCREERLEKLPPAILFGATKKHVEAQLAALKRRGIQGASIFDNTTKTDRKNRIRAFDTGRLDVLGSVSALSVGFDSPRAALMIGLRPLRRAIAEFMQSAGRIARADADKTRAWVLDYTGTVELMGRYTADRWRTGWSSLPKRAPRRRKRRWRCECGQDNPSDRLVCEFCNRPKPPAGEAPAAPTCERCNPPTLQKPGATVCRRCHRPMPSKTTLCPIHMIPLIQVGSPDGNDPEKQQYYCSHPGCEFVNEAELAVRQQAASDGLPIFRGSFVKDKPGTAWVRVPDEVASEQEAIDRPIWIKGRLFRIVEADGKIFAARSGDRIFKARIESAESADTDTEGTGTTSAENGPTADPY